MTEKDYVAQHDGLLQKIAILQQRLSRKFDGKIAAKIEALQKRIANLEIPK